METWAIANLCCVIRKCIAAAVWMIEDSIGRDDHERAMSLQSECDMDQSALAALAQR